MITPTWQSDCGQVQLYLGDCREILPHLGKVDAVVCDPPYGLSFMGKQWDYDVPTVEQWRLVFEAMKPGAHLLAFAGTRTQHRMAVNIEDAGFEIRDMIAWVYGSGFPKSKNLDGAWKGWGTALKPSLEPITLARKPLVGTVAENVMAHGTGAINVDGGRVGNTVETWPKSKSYGPGQFQPGGIGKTMATGSPPPGRWPANLIHDGSDEVLAGFPVTGASNGRPRNNGEFKSVAKGRDLPHVTHGHDDQGGSAARFFYCAKASKAERDAGCEGMESAKVLIGAAGHKTNPMTGKPVVDIPRRNHHPTVKPVALMRYLCRLVTPPGGIILDPFTGSGSTGCGAVLEGFHFIGIELDPEYIAIAQARIQRELAQLKLNL